MNPAAPHHGSGRPYQAPAWLPGGHAQTIVAFALGLRLDVPYRRELWESPDGDRVAVDFARPEPHDAQAPTLVLLHGLEGSSQSHYARSLMRACAARGWRALVVHFRGCGGEPNRLPRAYHSGDSAEVDWIVQTASQRWPSAALYAVGVSLGGNVLAKWLGERGASARRVRAAAVVSVPFDLVAAGEALTRGLNRAVYGRYFLRSMRRKAAQFELRFPGRIDAARVASSRDLREFDDAFTAPLHGFHDVMHYWRSASAHPWLAAIEVPMLALNARNDPFVPAQSLPTAARVSRQVVLEQPRHGGHAGFVQGPWPGNLEFMPNRVLEFFERGA